MGRTYINQYTVESFTDPDKTYKVSEKENGEWECGCPAWIYQRKKFPDGCKHIKAVIASISHGQESDVILKKEMIVVETAGERFKVRKFDSAALLADTLTSAIGGGRRKSAKPSRTG